MKELSLDLDALEPVRESYEAGRLQIVVGAGASIAAGLPGWNALNASLIAGYFNETKLQEDQPKSIRYEAAELDALSQVFADHFGKNAVIDLLRDDLEDDAFHTFLHGALYRGTKNYTLKPLHFELAAAVQERLDEDGNAHLYTLNYDDILEQALETVTGADPATVTAPGDVPANSVVHLHGYMPLEQQSDGTPIVEGEIILSEKDYHRTRDGQPDRQLDELLGDSDSDILLLGTSLSDPRLRRLLYERLEARDSNDQRNDGEIWAFMARKSPSSDADLAVRRAERMAANHVKPYWQSWDVEVLEVDNYEILPTALRAIRLGNDIGEWLEKGQNFLENHDFYDELYSEKRQLKAQLTLARTHELISQTFEVPYEEDLTFSFFVPSKDDPTLLQPAFRFSNPHRRHTQDGTWCTYPVDDAPLVSPLSPLAESGTLHLRRLTEDEAQERTLKIESLTEAEGATGLAIATGMIIDAPDSESFFREFPPEKRQRWNSERTYSSLLSIPVYDTQEWVPVGAACIASIRQTPFWETLDRSRRRDLESLMRSTFRNLLDYQTRF